MQTLHTTARRATHGTLGRCRQVTDGQTALFPSAGAAVATVALAFTLLAPFGVAGAAQPRSGQPAPAPAAASAEPAPLISREVLFGNPERAGVQLSNDGEWISFLAPLDDVLNIWIAPTTNPNEAHAITKDDDRGIRRYIWMPDNEHIVYLQDRAGDENWRAYAVNIVSGEEIDLTPMEGVQARIAHVSPDFPSELLLSINDRDPAWHDVYRINVNTGERTKVYENNEFVGFVIDDSFDIRLGSRMEDDGSATYLTIDEATGATEPYTTVPFEDSQTTSPVALDREGRNIYWVDSRGRNTAAVVAQTFDKATAGRPASKQHTVLFEDPRADAAEIMQNPRTGAIEAAASNYLRTEWKILDPAIAADLEYLRSVNPGEIDVVDRTLADDLWIVAYSDDNGPTLFYLYNRTAKRADFLFTSRPQIEGLPLAEMHGTVITTRDGLAMPTYFTLPAWLDANGDARPDAGPLPLVLLVHGGPWARDSWGYDAWHQWLSNRGYAVLSPNFRGSTGFGKDYLNAGNAEWADSMHTDLLDAANWAVEEGIADADRIAIVGGSYGGYAALAGLVYSPEFFACGVSIVGPSNLITLLESIPPYWAPILEMFTKRIADHRTPEGRRILRDMSPLTHVDEINRPLLIGQGANDPRVKQRESDQIVHAMQKKNLPVTYVLFPDEGHGFAKPENNKAFSAIMEIFLAEHLGGRFEPLGDAVAESSAQVLAMGDIELPGVEPTPWSYSEEGEAAASAAEEADERIPNVAYEDLNDLQKLIVDRTLSELEEAPPGALEQAIAQIEAFVDRVPEIQRPALHHLYHRLKAQSQGTAPTSAPATPAKTGAGSGG